MSKHEYDDNCADCRPAIFDMKTGKPLAADAPEQLNAMAIWDILSLEDRKAFHRFTCLNERDDDALALIKRFQTLMTDLSAGEGAYN